MDYQNDINEVIAFINGAILYGVADYNECLSRFTTPINEDYLQERADAIKQAIVTNNELQMAFRRLAVQCNEDSVCESCIVRNIVIHTLREPEKKQIKMPFRWWICFVVLVACL